MLILQLTFHKRLNDALKLSQIKIEVERFEIRIQKSLGLLETHSRNDFFKVVFESPLFRDIPPQGEKQIVIPVNCFF